MTRPPLPDIEAEVALFLQWWKKTSFTLTFGHRKWCQMRGITNGEDRRKTLACAKRGVETLAREKLRERLTKSRRHYGPC
jgi:hypothetical protein